MQKTAPICITRPQYNLTQLETFKMSKVSNKTAATKKTATKKPSNKTMVRNIDATKLSRKATKAATNDFEKDSKVHAATIEEQEVLKEQHITSGLSCWMTQGQALIDWKVAWIAAGGDPKTKKKENTWKTFITPFTRLSENDRSDAVFVASHWAKVSREDLSDNDLTTFSVSAIKKRIVAALKTPAQKAETKAKKEKREATAKATATQAQKDAADLKAFKEGKHASQQGTINIADIMKDPTKFGSIIGAMVNKTYDDKGKGLFIAAAGKKIVIKSK